MAKRKPAAKKKNKPIRPGRWLLRRAGVVLGGIVVLLVVIISLYAFVNPPTTPYIVSEGRRLGGVDREWVDMDQIAPVMARSVVAAEDANYCLHWGFDMSAIRAAIEAGSNRGASTISQQVVKGASKGEKSGCCVNRKCLQGNCCLDLLGCVHGNS